MAKGEPIFQEGDRSNDKCYVVLVGRCAVFRNETVNVKLQNTSGKNNEGMASMAQASNSLFDGQDKKLMRKLMYYGDMLATKKYGDQFGETALLTDAKRNASIVALEDCELMVFHKASLDLIKASYSNDIEEKRIFIIGLIPELGAIQNQVMLTKLVEYFRPKRFKKGHQLTKEGETGTTFYLLEEGEVAISKNLPIPRLTNKMAVEYVSRDTIFSVIQGGSVIAEDCLESSNLYKYSITVKSSEVKAYACEKSSASYSDLNQIFSILLKNYGQKEYIPITKD